MSKTTKAKANKGTQAASDMAIDFDRKIAHTLLNAMAGADTDGKDAKDARDNASLEFCRFAAATVMANESINRDTVTEGFCKHLDAMRPMLADESNPFVEVITADGKDARFVWKGHGNNVKSIARGVTEFLGVVHKDSEGQDYPALIDLDTAESFTDVKKSVEAARRYGESEDAVLLRESKEALRAACAELITEVIKSDDYELINEQALIVAQSLEDWNTALAEQTAADEKANKVEIPAEAQAASA